MTNSPEMRANPAGLKAAIRAHGDGLDTEGTIKAYLAAAAPHAQGDVAGLDNPLLPNKVLDDNYARAVMADGASGNMSMDTSVAMALIAEVRNARRGSLPHSDGAVAGWKLVPTEPNNDMIVAGEKQRPGSVVRVRDVYRAMLAAAPVSPINPVPAGVGDREQVVWNAIDQLIETSPTDGKAADGEWNVHVQTSQRSFIDGLRAARLRIRNALRQAPDAEQGAVANGLEQPVSYDVRRGYFDTIEKLVSFVKAGTLTAEQKAEFDHLANEHSWDGLSCYCGGGWLVGHRSGCPEAQPRIGDKR